MLHEDTGEPFSVSRLRKVYADAKIVKKNVKNLTKAEIPQLANS